MITGLFGVWGAETRLVPEVLKGDGGGQVLLDTLNMSSGRVNALLDVSDDEEDLPAQLMKERESI